MREILFRGKRIGNGQWVEGYLLEQNTPSYNAYIVPHIRIEQDNRHTDILEHEIVEVDPATVGQYTGLTDKNGRKIFEGDIVKTYYANVPKADFVEEVVFHNGKFCALYQKDTAKMWMPLADGVPHHPGDKAAYMEWCEVIGNIHDNPEMVKEEVDNG